MASKEVARKTISANVLDSTDALDVDTVLAILNGEFDLEDIDADAISKELMRRTLSAASVEDVLGEQPGTVSTQDLAGQAVEILDFSLRPGQFADSNIWMAVEAVNMTTGEKFTMSTSSRQIMAQIAKLKWLGALPQPVRIVKSEKQTTSGYYVYRLGFLSDDGSKG